MFLDDIVGPKPIKESKKTTSKNAPVKVLAEGDVIQHKFGIKQAQKGKTPYYKNPDIEIPMYDPARRANYVDGLSKGQPEAYDHFVVAEVSPTTAHIVGIAKDGTKVKVSTANKQLATVLVDAYNRGGFTDVALQRVPMGENAEELNVGDDVIVTGDVQYKGATGVITDFGQDKRFVVVNLYNHGLVSFHSSDVSTMTMIKMKNPKIMPMDSML